MTEPFTEFREIKVVLGDARGELKGLLSAVENLSKHLTTLTHVMTRALDQAESIASRAARMADEAAAALATKRVSQDAVHAELRALREQTKDALR
jgi:hypothetical protein